MATYSEAQKRAIYKYRAKKYKRVSLDVPTEDYEALKKAAAKEHESVSGFIKTAVKNRVDQVMDNLTEEGEGNDVENE